MWSIPLLLLSALPLAFAETSKPNTGPQPQGFLFGFSQTSLILPITYSCPSPLFLSAATPLSYNGPDASGPFSIVFLVNEQLLDEDGDQYNRWYSHTEQVADMNNARFLTDRVPWMNGTQFIACAWAANGVSGGCQDLFTVAPSEDLTIGAYANSSSMCRAPDVRESWATPRGRTLDVEMVSNTGTMSPTGWPSSCTDLQFRPKNGTGPYTTVIAPVQHPPINISSSESLDNYMNYTVRLTHGQAFMAAVYDSVGNSWAVGPMHAGNSDNLACLSTKTGQPPPPVGGIPVAAMGGGIVGAFIVGAGVAGLIFFLLDKRRKRQEELAARKASLDLYADPQPAGGEYEQKPMGPGMITPYDEPPSLNFMPAPISTQTQIPMSINTNLSPSAPDDSQVSPSSYRSRDQYDGNFNVLRSPTRMSGNSPYPRVNSPPFNSPPLNEMTSSSYGGETLSQLGVGESIHRPTSSAASASGDQAALSTRNLYVVHSDGGQDYHIQLPGGSNHMGGGMNVIELPPGYTPGGGSSSSGVGAEGSVMGKRETEKERLIRMSREQGGESPI